MKKLIRKLEEHPNIAILPTGILAVGSVFLYNFATTFVEDNKIGGFWETFIVMSSVLLMVITGILFLGLVSRAISRFFKKLSVKIAERKEKSSRANTNRSNQNK